MNQHPQKIGVYSDVDILGYEEAFRSRKQNYLSRLLYDRRRMGKETVRLMIPLRAYIRLESLLEYIPSSYILKVEDIIEMLVETVKGQYVREIAPKNVYANVRNKERRAKVIENGETTVLNYDKDCTKVTIKLDYKILLFLEGLMEDMDKAVEECRYTVEDFLSILFIDFMQRLQTGNMPALAREIGRHISGGETA